MIFYFLERGLPEVFRAIYLPARNPKKPAFQRLYFVFFVPGFVFFVPGFFARPARASFLKALSASIC